MSSREFCRRIHVRTLVSLAGLLVVLIGLLSVGQSAIGSIAGTTIWQASDAEQEPNETIEQANTLTIPGQRTGTVRYGDAAVIEFAYNNGPRDRVEDLFRFNIAPKTSQRVDIQLSFTNSAADLDLIFYRRESTGALTALEVSNGSTTTERITPPAVLPEGDYFIGVTAFDNPGNTAQTAYTLLLTGESMPAVPVISGISPVSANAGSGDFTLTVNGQNFYAGQSVVAWNGQRRATTFINAGQLVAFMNAADIATAGTAAVTVINPANLGGTSASTNFSILPAGVPEMEVEPNEISSQAGLIALPGRRGGTVGIGDAAGLTISLSNGVSDQVEDLYAVSLMESKRLDLRLTGTNVAADLALYLLEERAGTGQVSIIGSSRLKGSTQQLTTPFAIPSGRYLVGVSAITGQSSYVVEANVPGERRFQLNAASAAPGSIVSVPLTFMAQGNESQSTFSVAFDVTQMGSPEFVAGSLLNSAQVRVDKTEADEGRLGVEIRLPDGQAFTSGLVELGRIDLRLASGNQVRSSRIEFTDRPRARGLVDRNNQVLVGSYAGATIVTVPGFEADLVPRPNGSGDGKVTIADWTQTGRFVASLDAVTDGSEFQRADGAPRTTLGDGRLTIADWVMAGRYAAGLDQPVAAGGPSIPLPAATSAGAAVKIYNESGADGHLWQTVSSEQTGRAIRVRPDLFSRGRDNELVVELVSQGNENAIGFSIVYDTTQLSFVRATLGADGAGATLNINTSQQTSGRIGIGLALPTNQTFQAGVRQVVRMVFTVPQASAFNATTVSFGDLPVSREVVDSLANIVTSGYQAGEIRFDPPVELIPAITKLNPSTITAGGAGTSVEVSGTNFIDGAVVTIAGVDRQTTLISTTLLRVAVASEDVIQSGTLEVQVRNPAPGNGLSNKLTLEVINPVPVIESTSPDVVGVGGLSFTLTVIGRNFVPGSEIEFNGSRRPTNRISNVRLTTQINSADIASLANIGIRVINPQPGGGVSNQVTFAIKALNPLPRINSINPSSVEQGSGTQTIVITGTSFVDGASVLLGADRLTATYVSSTQLRVSIDGGRLTTPGNLLLSVTNPSPGGGNSNTVVLTVTPPRNPLPLLNSISPATILAGSQDLTLTLTGRDFMQTSTVQVNGETFPSNYVSATTMTIQITARMVISAENLSIRVVNPSPGGGGSTIKVLTVLNPVPVLTALSPGTVIDGGPSFTLSLIGSGFVPGSQVMIDGFPRTPNYVSTNQLSLPIQAEEIATPKSISVQVVNPVPAGGSSVKLSLIVRQPNPLPRVSAVRPGEVKVGGPGFLMTVEGVRFIPESVVRINGKSRVTEYISDTLLATRIEASELTVATDLQVSVFNPAPGGGQSSGVSLLVVNPTPRITSITPDNIAAGASAIDLVVFGDGFMAASIVRFNGVDLPTTLVTGTQLTARVSSTLLSSGGNQKIAVFNPAPGGGSSNIANLAVRHPAPSISQVSPALLTSIATPTTITVDGRGLVSNSVLRVNGQDRPTTLVDPTRLTAQLTASDVKAGATLSITVFNPEPGGGLSNSLALPVSNTAPVLTELGPTSIAAGSSAFVLSLTGNGFVPTSVVKWNGIARRTVYVSDKRVTAEITDMDVESIGSASVTVENPSPGGGISASLVFQIIYPVPTIVSLNPNVVTVGGTGFTQIINGVGYSPASIVRWNGLARPTTFVSRTELRVEVRTEEIVSAGTAAITVTNPTPGGGVSNNALLEIRNPVPNLTSTIPASIVAGSPRFTLFLIGSGFVQGASIIWNGKALLTTFVSSKELRAEVPDTDLAAPSVASLMVVNPFAAGVSNFLQFNITPKPNPVPVVEGLSSSSGLEGDPDLTIGVNGQGFVSGSTVNWMGSPRTTTFVNANRVMVTISPADLIAPGTFNLTVVSPGPGGGASNAVQFVVRAKMTNCQTVCMQSADYYLQNLSRLPRGMVWINRILYSVTSGNLIIKKALEGGDTDVQQLTREYTTTQLSILETNSIPGALNAELSCYRITLGQVTLSNGEIISRQTRLSDLFNATRVAITDNRSADMLLLLKIYQLINGNDPLNRCR